MNDRYCRDCIYRVHLFGKLFCCNYLIATNHKRPCPPGDGCTVKVSMKVKRKRKKGEDGK